MLRPFIDAGGFKFANYSPDKEVNMYSKAKIAGHPIHPMIVAFPICFYTLSLIAFAVYRFGSLDIFWYRLGYFCTFAGVATAIVAAVPGFIDWFFGVPKQSAARKRGLIHMLLNVTTLVLFIINAVMLSGHWNVPRTSLTGILFLSFVGVILTVAAGYHGWEMIATHKVGVTLTPDQERIEPVEKYTRREHEVNTRRDVKININNPRTI
jgi:uncharacterized membrane protein